MKITICFTALLLTFTSVTFSQSNMTFDAGTDIVVETGADICADTIIINGTWSGGGTKCGGALHVILANLKVLLQGPFNTGTNLMNNSLRSSVLPTQFSGKPIPASAVDSIQIEIRGTTGGVLSPTAARVIRVEVDDALQEATSQSGDDVRSPVLEKSRLKLAHLKLAGAEANDLAGGKPASPLVANPKSSQPAWLLVDGTIRNFTDTTKSYVEFDTTAGNYFVVIRHRNHLAIMTAATQALSGLASLYDFTTAQTQAFGTNPMNPVGSVFAMVSGDASGNGQVANSDINSIIRPALGQSGYKNGDVNLNGQVATSDINTFTRPNIGRGTQVSAMPSPLPILEEENTAQPISVNGATSVNGFEGAPTEFSLKQNYPNPFNPTTEIKFSVESSGQARLDIFNVVGQKVATLFDEMAIVGQYYKVKFDATNFPSGVYLYRLQSGKRSELKKLVLLK